MKIMVVASMVLSLCSLGTSNLIAAPSNQGGKLTPVEPIPTPVQPVKCTTIGTPPNSCIGDAQCKRFCQPGSTGTCYKGPIGVKYFRCQLGKCQCVEK